MMSVCYFAGRYESDRINKIDQNQILHIYISQAEKSEHTEEILNVYMKTLEQYKEQYLID